jgi:predicted TPR repeat methyltransferase
MTVKPPRYFDRLYAANADPWKFETSVYEQNKYSKTLDFFEHRHFRNAFEVGCSIGVFTKMLAPHCDTLLAVDLAARALSIATARCSALPHVNFQRLQLPREWPADKKFDLILLSEILYFLTPPEIFEMARLACASLTPDGWVLLVNYTEPIDEPCGGEEATDIFLTAAMPHLIPLRQASQTKFRMDLFYRNPHLSWNPNSFL